jgi:predicted DNA-binding transcriptional regulator AlpA
MLVAANPPTATEIEALLDEKEISRILRVSTGTLRAWRCEGRGPRFVKMGQMVRYSRQDVRAWLAQLPTGGCFSRGSDAATSHHDQSPASDLGSRR